MLISKSNNLISNYSQIMTNKKNQYLVPFKFNQDSCTIIDTMRVITETYVTLQKASYHNNEWSQLHNFPIMPPTEYLLYPMKNKFYNKPKYNFKQGELCGLRPVIKFHQ